MSYLVVSERIVDVDWCIQQFEPAGKSETGWWALNHLLHSAQVSRLRTSWKTSKQLVSFKTLRMVIYSEAVAIN